MRVLIVDDHAAVRRGVRSTVQGYNGIDVIGEATDGEEAVESTAKLHPDLIIMDVSMPHLDGLSAAGIIKKYYPGTRIVIFSMHNIREFAETAKDLGLNAYVAKEDNGPSLRHALDAVIQDQTYFPALSSC